MQKLQQGVPACSVARLMLGSRESPEALPGLHAMLLRQQGTESLVCQQQHGTLHGQLGHKMMVAPREWPNAQLAGGSGV